MAVAAKIPVTHGGAVAMSVILGEERNFEMKQWPVEGNENPTMERQQS